jgi:hypothetical protein
MQSTKRSGFVGGHSMTDERNVTTIPLMDYERWLTDVRSTLDSLNMPMDDWQGVWAFEFRAEFNSGTKPDDAAMKANRY